MSLYHVQKLLYRLNKDAPTRARFKTERDAVLAEHELTADERRAFVQSDAGALYVMGAPFAGRAGLSWPDYLAALKRAQEAKSRSL